DLFLEVKLIRGRGVLIKGMLHLFQQDIGDKRFRYIIGSPVLHGLYGCINRCVTGNQYYRDIGLKGPDTLQNIYSAHTRHFQIGYDEIEFTLLHDFDGAVATRTGVDNKGFSLQNAFQAIPDNSLVINYQKPAAV